MAEDERERERKHKFCGKCRRVSSISKGKYGDEARPHEGGQNTGGEKCCRKTGRNEHKARTARVVEVGEKKGEGGEYTVLRGVTSFPPSFPRAVYIALRYYPFPIEP